jgi:hypothetical protein
MTRRVLFLLAVAPVCLMADERAEREAIQSAIGALNERQWRAATITSDPKALAEFQRLLRRKNLTWQIRPGVGRPATVNAQHGMFTRAPVKAQAPSIELKNPRVVPGAVELVSDDRAIAHAALVEYRGTAKESTPLVFTMKKVEGVWKIAELKVGPDPRLLATPR